MRYIADVNVLLQTIAEGHSHRTTAVAWWEVCNDGDIGLSLPVHMALLRLLSNRRVVGSSLLAPEQVWNVLSQLAGDPRVVSIENIPQTHSKHRRAKATRRQPTPDLWSMAGGIEAIAPMRNGHLRSWIPLVCQTHAAVAGSGLAVTDARAVVTQ